MKRCLVIVGVFLLAGAAVNVAVAWGCAARLDFGGAEQIEFQVHETDRRWDVVRSYKPGLVSVYSRRNTSPWETISSETLDGMSHPLLPRYWLGMRHRTSGFNPYFCGVGSGWPCKALWYDYVGVGETLGGRLRWSGKVIIKNAVPLPSKIEMDRTSVRVTSWPRGLPLRLVVDGFAVNTLFYAGVLSLLICGPLVLRRFIRRRRGLCPACGYPRGESAVCSECGHTLPGLQEAMT